MPELLHAIIFLLPSEDILVVQRVSKFWKATIDGSLMQQQALGFKPLQPSQYEPKRRHAYFSKKKCAYAFFSRYSLRAKGPIYNPLFEALCPTQANGYNFILSKKKAYAKYTKSLRDILKDGKNGSLRKAFVVQPPAMQIKVFVRKGWCLGEEYCLGIITNANGVTIADVLGSLESNFDEGETFYLTRLEIP